MRKFVILLLILVVVLVAADRISAYVAQRKVASRVAGTYSLPDPPTVTIQGFPFLTQVVAGHYSQVDVALSAVTAGGVEMRDLRARFTGVRAPLARLLGNGPGTVSADDAAATALIPFASVSRRLPLGITLSPDGGAVKLSGKIGYLGFEVPVSAAVSLHVTATAIEISPRNVTVGGTVPVPPGPLGSRLAIALPVHDLPMHLKVTSVRVTDGGFEVSASARGVEFENNG
jgi:LmeA-like phospholipid-binding